MDQAEDVADAVALWSEQADEPDGYTRSWSTKRDVATLRKEVKDMQGHFDVLSKEVFGGLEALESLVEQKQNSGNEAATAPAEPERIDGILVRLAALESAVSDLRSARNDSPAPLGNAPQVEQVEPPPPEERVDVEEVDEKNVDAEQYDYIPDAYTFQESVWDATILLFCRNSDGKPLVSTWDVVILIFSFLLNVGVQSMFLVIVGYDMLPRVDFNGDTVGDFLAWRAEYAHVLAPEGMPYIKKLCDRSYTDWSWLKGEVETYQTYIADAGEGETLISGQLLSLMSLILWTMTCLNEYRAVVEQAVGIWLLPVSEDSPWRFGFGRTKHTIEDGAISGEIVNMPTPTKALILAIMSFPRMALLITLSLFGIEFVAHTSSLVDLVLNAIALAFVLDIDDFLASILLTKHVRDSCTEMKALTCGRTMRGCWMGCTRRDMLKLLVWATLMALGIGVYLQPYYNTALASVDALCDGNVDFIVRGANGTVPTTIVVDMDDASVDSGYYQTCEAALQNLYYRTKYPSLQQNISGASSGMPVQETIARAKAITLDYAFLPPDARQPMRKNLQSELEKLSFAAGEVEYPVWSDWSAADMQDCPRFETHYQLGWAACTPMPVLDETIPNCSWTRGAELCDGDPPGDIYRRACGLSSQADKLNSCYVWEAFGVEDPYLNCEKVRNGIDVELDASLGLEVADLTFFVAQIQDNSTIYDALVRTLADALESLPEGVAAPHSSPLDLRSVTVVDKGELRRLHVIDGEEGSAAEGRALNVGGVNDTNTSITTTPAGGSGTLAGELDIPFRVLQAPDTLTKDYFSQVNWAQVADHLSSVLTVYDKRLRVLGFLSQSSAIKTAYCNSYIWCEDSLKALKANAAAIQGASEEACCDQTCWYWRNSYSERIPKACESLTTPSEILRSVDALKAVVVNDPTGDSDFHTCCEEQLRCDVFNGSACVHLNANSVLINDAHKFYQGPQVEGAPDDVNDNMMACCSLSCQTVQDASKDLAEEDEDPAYFCNAALGLTLVASASDDQPIISQWEWYLEFYPVINDFYNDCCEQTTVLCSTWVQSADGACEETVDWDTTHFRANPDADVIYGEHNDLCCTTTPITCSDNDYYDELTCTNQSLQFGDPGGGFAQGEFREKCCFDESAGVDEWAGEED